MPSEHLWIPVTIFAAFAQTVRNAAQRHLTSDLGTMGATLVRFLYGVPFAIGWLLVVKIAAGEAFPATHPRFWAWVLLAAVSQIGAVALLLRVMAERNFGAGVAYSKSEIVLVAIFGLVFLGDPVTLATAAAIACGTVGVILLGPIDRARPWGTLASGWASRVALFGLGSGTLFSFASVGYRGAALALEDAAFPMAAAVTTLAAQVVQTVLLGAWLFARNRTALTRVLVPGRMSWFAGLMGTAATAALATAMAIEPVAHVRTLALVELIFSYAVSHRIFRERLAGIELVGVALLVAGVVTVALGR